MKGALDGPRGRPKQDGGPLAASTEMGHQLFPIHFRADSRSGIVPTACNRYEYWLVSSII